MALCEDELGKGVAVQEFLAKPCTTDQYYLGECCRWDDVRGELYWIDILTGRFFRAHADGPNIDIVHSYKLEGSLSALAPSAQRSDGWIVALDQSLLLLGESGETREVARPEGHHVPAVRMNDGAADPWGRFWIGSMAVDDSVGAGSLYRFQESTGVEMMKDHVTVSNGLGWSPDRRTMYYVDSGPRTIHAFDVDESGEISHQRPFVQFNTNEEGAPDGLCVDTNGNLWVAVWGGYEVRQYSPGAEQLARVADRHGATLILCPVRGQRHHVVRDYGAREYVGRVARQRIRRRAIILCGRASGGSVDQCVSARASRAMST
jgi:sugar lactone lactonase YvrE